MAKIVGLAMLAGLGEAVEESRRLTVVNGCDKTMWIAHEVGGQSGPDAQNNRIEPGQSKQFLTSKNGAGLVATRYWPKMGCDSAGNNCTIGESGGPEQGCVIRKSTGDDYSHCNPPADTKFEASFAPPDNPKIDVVDMSLVDGYSLPFKLEITSGSCTRHEVEGGPAKAFTKMDCSQLSFGQCPSAETLSGKTVSLKAVNPKTGTVAGCYSPCMKLTESQWQDSPVDPASGTAAPYCCAGAYGTPGVCKPGPIIDTQYLKAVRSTCPAAYGYAYDDKTATIICNTATHYKVTFYCPSDSPVPPSPPSPPSPTPPAPAPSPSSWDPCGTHQGRTCCNPHVSPKQMCPSMVECSECGGGDACECPSAGILV